MNSTRLKTNVQTGKTRYVHLNLRTLCTVTNQNDNSQQSKRPNKARCERVKYVARTGGLVILTTEQ